MVIEEKRGTKVVLTKPLSLEGETEGDYRAPNLLQRILSLFKNVRPGSDLTTFQLTPLFNMAKSHLQCYGESVYCTSNDLLSRCNNGETCLDRFTSVVAWNVSTLRPMIFGVAPYNSILGETHHVSRGNLNVLLEQISHHPPVSALHATDEKENIEMIWCQHPVPKFYGTSVEAEVNGKKQVKLLSKGETYEMNSPKMLIRFLPVPRINWVGKVSVRCEETDLEAELWFRTNSFLGFGGQQRALKGKIYQSSSKKELYAITGHWDRTVTRKDLSTGKEEVIYDAKEAISGLKTPIVKDLKEVWGSESAAVWSEVSEGILSKDWEKAREAKKEVEEKQRVMWREREVRGETWVPNHFTVSFSKEDGWDCSPIHKWVPPAPIIVPF